MNKYTFFWTISPSATVEYADTIPPFDVVIGRDTITLTTRAKSADAQLIDQANEVAHDVAGSLSYEHSSRSTSHMADMKKRLRLEAKAPTSSPEFPLCR